MINLFETSVDFDTRTASLTLVADGLPPPVVSELMKLLEPYIRPAPPRTRQAPKLAVIEGGL